VLRTGEPADGPAWKVRAATVECLERVGDGELPHDAASTERANRLLASYVRHILGTEPPTMQALFGTSG
jgi:hypothetical protein